MPSYLVLVRHAPVQIDPAIPSPLWPLTPNGRSTTRQLARRLKPYQLAHIITSEEPKAQATGAALAEVLHLPNQTAPGLHEHDRQGVPYFESMADFAAAVATFFAHPDELVFGRETAVQAAVRITQAVNRVLEASPDANFAIVSHGTVLTLFICQHNPKLSPMKLWQSLTLPCAFILTLPGMQLAKTILMNEDEAG